MESANSESMLEILNECLKDSNLETVSKAELRKKYLEKIGLAKLPREDKKLFNSTVNTAYLNYITEKTAAADKVNADDASANETKESGQDWKLTMSSSSDEDITPGNIKEDVICDLYTNGENDIKVESSSDLDEKSLASHKNNINKKSPLISGQRGKRALISSSEDEAIEPKPTEKNKLMKKARRCSDLEQPITKSEKKKKVPQNIKNQNRLRNVMIESSDSEDEPLHVFQKKSDTLHGPLISVTKSDESENEHLSKYMKKQVCNPVNFEDELIMSSTKKKTKLIDHSSSSEDEPLKIFKKSTDYTHSNREKGNFETKVKSNGFQESLKPESNSCDSDDEPLTKYRECNSSVHSDKNSNSFSKKKSSSKKFCRSVESDSSSEDEYLAKYSKKVNNYVDSSDSENEPLNNLGNKKIIDSGKKPSEKTVEKKVKHSLKKSLASNSKSKDTSKKKILISSEDDSDEQPIATLSKISDPVNNFQKLVKSSDESDDELLNNVSNKKTQHSEKETAKKVIKKKIKDSFKKSPTNKKTIEHTLKKKKYVNSDDVANLSNQKKKFMNGQIDSLLSDSSEDEPLSHINKPNYTKNSEHERNILNRKEEKSFNEERSFPLSESSEDEPLSNMTKKVNGSSDSEDAALSKLSTKNSDKKQKNSGSCSSSFVDENEEQSSRKNMSSKRKEANVSGKKRSSASENKIEHLKKYLRVAGIRISNYNKLFENCKTMKAKCEKMMSLLEKEGLKGRPTLEKCKKLRVKIETKREIAELDVSNILKDRGGRPKRSVCSDTTNCKQEEAKTTPIKKFSRLQDIVDSEESD